MMEFSSLTKRENVWVIDEGKRFSMLSPVWMKEKDELSLATVHLRIENRTTKCQYLAVIKDNAVGTQVSEQG